LAREFASMNLATIIFIFIQRLELSINNAHLGVHTEDRQYVARNTRFLFLSVLCGSERSLMGTLGRI